MSDATASSSSDQALYLERLDTLYEKGLSDIRAFAQRESRPFDEVGLDRFVEALIGFVVVSCMIVYVSHDEMR